MISISYGHLGGSFFLIKRAILFFTSHFFFFPFRHLKSLSFCGTFLLLNPKVQLNTYTMETNERRGFIKKSFFGLAGASVLPTALKAQSHSNALPPPLPAPLPVRTLGKTGLKVPLISIGTGGQNNPALVKAAYENGVKLFFTATYYGEGNNEKMLGDALRGFPRDSYYIGTAALPKGVDHKNGLYTKESDYDSLIKKVDDSLKRLGVDHVDFLLLPFAAKRESVFFEPLLKAMQDLKTQGKTRFIGIASHGFTDEALRAAADTKVYDMAMIAYNFRQENQAAMRDAITYAANAGVGIVTMKTQSGGFWDKERTQPINSKATIKWVLQNENIASVVSGMTKLEELQQNIALMQDLQMTEQEKKDLRLAGNQTPGLYCQQCGVCVPQCRYGLDIPTTMRSYMYAYGYRDLAHAHHTLGIAGVTADSCGNCPECLVDCPMGFNVREKIRDIARLKEVPTDFIMS